MTTMNGHHSSYKMKCPNDGCSAIILDSQLGTHLVTECEFRQRTCDLCMEDYVLIDEEQHLDSCPYIVQCPNSGCRLMFLKNQLNQHLEKECDYRHAVCLYCNEEYNVDEEEIHKRKCDIYPTECINSCGKRDIPRKDMEVHLQNCPLWNMSCDYEVIGCAFVGTQSERDFHEKEDAKDHLRMAIGKIQYLELQIDLTQNTFQKLNSFDKEMDKIKNSVSKISSLEKEVALGKDKIFELETRLNLYEKQKSSFEENKPDSTAQPRKKVPFTEPLENPKENGSSSPPNQIPSPEPEFLSSTIINKAYREAERIKYGIYMWSIKDYKNKLIEAKKSDNKLCSPLFRTSKSGYALRLVVNLNGWGKGRGTHVGLSIQLAKGPNDENLSWPYKGNIVLTLLHPTNESKHKVKTINPLSPQLGDEVSECFMKPGGGYNAPYGWGNIISHESLLTKNFIVNDTIHVMCRANE